MFFVDSVNFSTLMWVKDLNLPNAFEMIQSLTRTVNVYPKDSGFESGMVHNKHASTKQAVQFTDFLFLFLVNYVEERPQWPIQSPNKERKKKAKG